MSSEQLDSGRRRGTNARAWIPSQPNPASGILLEGLLTLFGLSLGLFALTRLVPGGPCAAYYGDRYFLSSAQHATCSTRFGLGQSIVSQYLLTIGGYLCGDFGYSINSVPIWNTVADHFPDTVVLLGGAIIVQTALAVLVGTYAARHIGGRVDRVVLTVTEGASWMPPVRLWYLLTMGLVVDLRWLPASTEDIRLPVFWSAQWFAAFPRNPGLLLGDQLRHLIIPLAAIVLPGTAVATRVVRHAVLAARQHPKLRTARAPCVSWAPRESRSHPRRPARQCQRGSLPHRLAGG